MNISKILPLGLLLILGLGAFYYLNKEEETSTLSSGDWEMHVENEDDIHRIFIANRNGETADVIRSGDHWIYNGKYRANENVIYHVLNTLTKMRLKFRPSESSIPNMLKVLATSGTKVEVFDKEGNKLTAFYVGGSTPDELGTYMILDGSENPYVMFIPKDEVSLKQRFFTGDKKWRDKTIFREKVKDIQSFSLEYPKRKNKSFVLNKEGGSWKIDPKFITTKRIDKLVNQDLVESYLKGFQKVGAEAFEERNEYINQLIQTKEFCVIHIGRKDGSEKSLRIFPIIKYEDEENTKPLAVDRYIALNEKGETFLIQHLVFKKLFWAYDFFFDTKNK